MMRVLDFQCTWCSWPGPMVAVREGDSTYRLTLSGTGQVRQIALAGSGEVIHSH